MAKLRKTLAFEPVRKDAAKRQVFGWAYSSILDGVPVIDHDRDTIPPSELESAAYNYVKLHRVGSNEHDKIGVSECIESVFVDKSKAQAMGLGKTDSARWWVGFQIHDAATWAQVEAGELREFSIGGESVREPHPEVPDAYVLKNLNINEIALVGQGAGRGVPVRVAKRKGMNMERIIKAAKTAAKLNDEQVAILKGLTAGKVEKGDLRPTLEAAGLDENQMAIVMGLLEAAMAPPGAAVDGSGGESKPAEVESAMEEEKAEDEPEMDKEEDEPMAKSDPQVRKAMAELAKMKADLAKERHLRRFEKAKARAEKDFSGVPDISPDHLAEVLIMVEDGVLGEAGEPLVKALTTAHELATTGDGLFKSFGANAGGRTVVHGDAWAEVEPLVKKHKAAGLTHSQAISKALEEHAASRR